MPEVTWEYKVLSVTSEIVAGGEETLEPVLDELGSEGWELVAVDASTKLTLYVFKRPLLAIPDEDDYEEGDEDEEDDEDYDEDGTVRIPAKGR